MTCEVIATGSKGNAVLLNGAYLIDCGVPFGKIKPYIRKIRLVFLTHIHSDHFSAATIRKIHDHRPGIRFVCCRNLLVDLCSKAGVSPNNITVLEPGQTAVFSHLPEGQLRVRPFELVHNVPNYGWLFESNVGSALYATDTRYIPISAPNLDLYMVECNYKGDELERRKERKLAAGGFVYEDNVAACHMSFETVMAWLSVNATPHSKVVFLHQHVETMQDAECRMQNDSPVIARSEATWQSPADNDSIPEEVVHGMDRSTSGIT